MLNRLIKWFFIPIYFSKAEFIGSAIAGIGDIFSGIPAGVANAIGSVGSALIGSNAAQGAASTQAGASQNALNQQLGIYNQNTANMQPYLGLGQQGTSTLQSLIPSLSTAPSVYNPATSQDIMNNLAPNYQFMLNQGLGANAQNVNVGGGGSNVNRSNNMFAENYAGNAYQNALNNYMTQQQSQYNQLTGNQTNIYNRLAGIAGIGASTAGALAGVGVQTGNQIGSTLSNIGSANASGIVGSANALSGGITGVANSSILANLLSGGNQGGITSLSNGGQIPTNQLANYASAFSSGG